MSRIVVGYDSYPFSEHALRWAAQEARLRDVELHVVTVIEEDVQVTDVEKLRGFLRGCIESVAAGVRFEQHLRSGHPAASLVDFCQPDDLLVVGSQSTGRLDWLLGSVARGCLHAGRCAVTLVRSEPPTEPHGVVLAALDGSPASRSALLIAAQEASIRGAALHVVHVVHWDSLGVELVVPSDEELVSWGEALVQKELAQTGVTASVEVVNGHPNEILTLRSEEVDLLVLGWAGRSPLGRLFAGSTAEHCARHASCPTMVVPEAT